MTKFQSDASWEEKAIDSSVNSLKYEAWTITFIVIIAAAMVPDLQPYIKVRLSCPKGQLPRLAVV